MKCVARILMLALLALLPAVAAQAGVLPVQVTVATNSAEVRIGSATSPLADLSLRFDSATGLSAANLGIKAETISVNNPALLARLPSSLTSIPAALPLLVTIEPPATGTLSQRRVTHVELHTHALAYAAGSPLRLFKAQIGGPFRDITESVQPGSVRTRGTTPGWSQFLVLVDDSDEAPPDRPADVHPSDILLDRLQPLSPVVEGLTFPAHRTNVRRYDLAGG